MNGDKTMKQFILISLILTSFSLIYLLPVFAAGESSDQETILIESYKEDVTGDGLKEEIQLKGVQFSNDSGYFHNVWADIKGPQTKQWKIMYEGGYKPSLQFEDLNHDGVFDVFYKSSSGGSGGMNNYHLNTLKSEHLTTLQLPEAYPISGEFENGFNAALAIEPGGKPIIVDVKERASEYIRMGIYDKKGKIIKDTKLMIDPIAYFEPTLISKSKGFGLKSHQHVNGAYHADQLGTIEALWYFENGKWIKLKNEWKATDKK